MILKNIWVATDFGLYKKDERTTDFMKILNGSIRKFCNQQTMITSSCMTLIMEFVYMTKTVERNHPIVKPNKIGKSTLEKLNKTMPSVGKRW